LFTDGEASYASLFPEIFGQAYRKSRQGNCGRFPDLRYRIPRTLAHVQIVKHREGQRVVEVDIRYTHGSMRCVQRVLDQLGYTTPNTSAIERRNGTARRMNAHQVRRSLAFSRRDDTKIALGWWGLTVYNWSRPHRSLRLRLPQPQDKKVHPSHPRDGLGPYRPPLVCSADSAHPGVLIRRSEIISHDYHILGNGRIRLEITFPQTGDYIVFVQPAVPTTSGQLTPILPYPLTIK